jgi:hypothetical protein
VVEVFEDNQGLLVASDGGGKVARAVLGVAEADQRVGPGAPSPDRVWSNR